MQVAPFAANDLVDWNVVNAAIDKMFAELGKQRAEHPALTLVSSTPMSCEAALIAADEALARDKDSGAYERKRVRRAWELEFDHYGGPKP